MDLFHPTCKQNKVAACGLEAIFATKGHKEHKENILDGSCDGLVITDNFHTKVAKERKGKPFDKPLDSLGALNPSMGLPNDEHGSTWKFDIAWAVASLLQFGPDSSRIKAAADFPVVDQGKVP